MWQHLLFTCDHCLSLIREALEALDSADEAIEAVTNLDTQVPGREESVASDH